VPDSQATQIVEHLREVLPGYAVPRLVREVAGQAYKVPLELENNSR
jgi:L-lysine 2,3-aminomutase